MIILGSKLTTFESSSVFGGSWDSIENWLEPKTEPQSVNLVCPCLLCTEIYYQKSSFQRLSMF